MIICGSYKDMKLLKYLVACLLNMSETKANIVARLQKEILLMQGFKSASPGNDMDIGPMKQAFPNRVFPLGAVHEFICGGKEDAAVTSGFIAGLLGSLSKKAGVILWVSAARTLFPPALTSFGIAPERIIFVDLSREKEILWAMEEGLKCGALSAVIGEIRELDFIVSRRLQLAVEQSQVTGFIIRQHPRILNTTACVTRWKITSLPSDKLDDLPGISYPKWNVELLKVRNGKPGTWQLEWVDGRFNPVHEFVSSQEFQKKAG